MILRVRWKAIVPKPEGVEDSAILFIYLFIHLFILVGLGLCTQAFTFAKQVLYRLSHTSNPFCFCYFGDRVSRTIYPGWLRTTILPISVFQVARIIGYL
jgi:hypothetical protein